MTAVISRLPTDVEILESSVELTDLRFTHPLTLSSGEIREATYASVTVTVRDRRGRVGQGRGGIVLSDLWAFPSPDVPQPAKAALMRDLVTEIARVLPDTDGHRDPFQIARTVQDELPTLVARTWNLPDAVPRLAAMVCWAPFDAAVHDAWGRAAGASSYRMYTADCLNADLSEYLGPAWAGQYPGAFLRPARGVLGVQHVVGLGDALTGADSLSSWIDRDGVSFLKLKVTGRDVEGDLARIVDVHDVAAEALRRQGNGTGVRMCIDANEGAPSPEPVIELLRKLREASPAAYDALSYVEQPTPRELADYRYTLHALAELKPVVVDESLDSLGALPLIESQGWSGVALKTCKGQSHSLIAYSWARRQGMFITVQDLTNPGLALVQSANLANHLTLSVDAIEYNSRQYLDEYRLPEASAYQRLFDVHDGEIDLAEIQHTGLY